MLTPLTEAEAAHVGQVFDAHHGFIEAVARRHTRSPQDVPDVVQTVGVQVCRRLSGFRGHAGITTWLYRVTVNAAIDAWRGEQRLVKARQALLERRPGDVRRSGPYPAQQSQVNNSGEDEAQGYTLPRRTILAASAPAVQLESVLEAQRAAALHEGLAHVTPVEADCLRDEMAGVTVKASRQARHRARIKLRAVLASDPRVV